MSQTSVQSILDQIERLPEADRLLLEQRLAEMADAEWRREAEAGHTARPRTGHRSGGDRPGHPRPAPRPMKVFFDANVYVAEALCGAAEEMLAATERAGWRVFFSGCTNRPRTETATGREAASVTR